MLITEKNMHEEAVEPQEQVEQVTEETHEQEVAQENQEHETEKTQVPLSALQKERQRRKEIEMENQWLKQNYHKPAEPQEEDLSKYESVTREDLAKHQTETARIIKEEGWIERYPDRKEFVDEHLPTFLKQRPNLTTAISAASNRYEEAYILMNALSPKQQTQLKAAPPSREVPKSPGGVPKGAAINEALDIMGMSDSEFSAWRQQKRRGR